MQCRKCLETQFLYCISFFICVLHTIWWKSVDDMSELNRDDLFRKTPNNQAAWKYCTCWLTCTCLLLCYWVNLLPFLVLKLLAAQQELIKFAFDLCIRFTFWMLEWMYQGVCVQCCMIYWPVLYTTAIYCFWGSKAHTCSFIRGD